ncbi:MAG: CCA tRNA nucleotidyltransferase [Spirochaetota bacterium]
MGKFHIHPAVLEVARIFKQHHKEVFLVGGAVRDLVRGKDAKDWDLATNAKPGEVQAMFRRVIPTGIKHGTVTILYRGLSIETTTFRTEGTYSDGRRPDTIRFANTIEEDLSRRDFSMNALALELPEQRLVDPYDGQADIKKRIIRCVGEAAERFSEDGLRPLRAIRFAAQLQFSIEPNTLAAIPLALPITAKVAIERVRDELDKILGSEQPSQAFRLMEATGMLSLFLPELQACRNVEQKGFHQFDVLDHLLFSCDAAPRDKLVVRLAALLHDIGKPAVRAKDELGIWTFYRHEEVSTNMARDILSRLKYPNAVIDQVCHLISVHMFHYDDSWTDAAVRRFIVRVGEAALEDLLDLRRADTWGTFGKEPPAGLNQPLVDRVHRVLAKDKALSIKDLAVNGEDLAQLGIPRGPLMGRILKELFETVLDDPGQNTKETLLRIAQRLHEKLT